MSLARYLAAQRVIPGEHRSLLTEFQLMEVAGLILGIVGSATGIGALVWQVITWNRSGPIVSVTANQAFPDMRQWRRPTTYMRDCPELRTDTSDRIVTAVAMHASAGAR